MNTCAYCDTQAIYRDRESGDYLCLAHARLEVVGLHEQKPKSSLTIRPAVHADRPRIAELAHYFWDEVDVECFGQSYQVDTLPAYVACEGDKIVGVASYACEEDGINLVMLNVLPQWHGQGAARELIAAVTQAARVEGTARIIVTTTNDDLPALGLYQRLGFTITNVLVGKMLEHHGGIELGFAGIPVRDEIQMELRLRASG
jgi:ribosomal protein S18 acetylase RimI-like enzyme